jgi:hypothetical protein
MSEDVGDEVEVTKKVKGFQLIREREVEEMKQVLNTYGGRATLWRLLEECAIYTFGFCGDNDLLNHREGKREVGGWLIREIAEASPSAYMQMQNEAVSRDTDRGKLKGKKADG